MINIGAFKTWRGQDLPEEPPQQHWNWYLAGGWNGAQSG